MNKKRKFIIKIAASFMVLAIIGSIVVSIVMSYQQKVQYDEYMNQLQKSQ